MTANWVVRIIRKIDSSVFLSAVGWCFIIALVALIAIGRFNLNQDHGVVYATWPDEVCRHVEPKRFSCDDLPPVIDDIVWVSPEWKP